MSIITTNISSQIIVQDAVTWAADASVYSSKHILVVSDVYFDGTNCRKFKIADGINNFNALDFVPDANALLLSINLADTLTNGNKTGEQQITSNNSQSILALLDANTSLYYEDTGAGVTSSVYLDTNNLTISRAGTISGTLDFSDTAAALSHDVLVTISAPNINLVGATASRVLITDGSSNIKQSSVTTAEIGYVSGVTSAIQSQLNNKQPLNANLTSWSAITRASGFDTFTASPSSANFLSLITDETGTGSLVFSNSPTFTGAPVLPTGTIGVTQSPFDNSTKIATTAYVDSAVANLDAKTAVAYCSTSALPANTYSNGSSGVGATLTGTSNGPLLIDGVTLVIGQAGESVLVAGESTQANNGWYTITQVGVIAVSPYILTRRVDSDQSAEIGAGYLTSVTAPNTVTPGSSNNGKVFISVAADPFTIGTTALTFSQVGNTYFAGTGLTLTGQTFSLTAPVTIALGGTNNTTQVTNGVNYYDGTKIKSLATFLFDGTNLGIGATPDALLTVSKQTTIVAPISGSSAHYIGLDANPLRITYDTHNTGTAGTAMMLRRSRGTAASPSALVAGDTMGSVNTLGYGATGYAAASTGLATFKANQNFDDTKMGTYYTIFTTPDNSVTAAEALRVLGNGKLNITQAAGALQINGTDVITPTSLGAAVLVTKAQITGYQGYNLYGQLATTGQSPADASTYYAGWSFINSLTTTGATMKMFIPKSGTIKTCYINGRTTGALGTNENSTFALRLNNTTDTTISSTVVTNTAQWEASNTGLSIAVVAGDYIEMKWTTPTWATNPVNTFFAFGFYIE